MVVREYWSKDAIYKANQRVPHKESRNFCTDQSSKAKTQ